MTGRYPIVRHRELRPRWRLSAWRERRHPLIAGPGQVLVHVVDGAYTTETADPARCTALTLVDVRPDRRVSARWEVTASGSDWDFPVTVTFRCTVVDPIVIVRSRWDVQFVLAQDHRPWSLMRTHPVGDEDGLRLALTALLQARPAHQDIDGVRVELAEVSVGPARFVVVDEA
ncbi:hypothetical protein JHN63_08860 [Streptomyces sp. MBT65]|uniref:hypothetical protein n=1 Tax=Streptomyces sp. MBT65 TaxID=1488395 RepID=UPI00190A78D0|nr:hypothetical protein [Streptomyces sp. MBT65]MBK3573927.1 hypothetical protein [Streptomyces sp. MBT65]